jgi:hypothetical protein
MNIRLIKTLSFIALFLVIIIIAESSYAKYANLKLKRELQDIVAGNIDTEVLPSINLKEKPIENYLDLINRPLFNNTRRIIEDVATETVVNTTVKTTNFKHELIGIFGSDIEINALFRKKSPRNVKNKNQRFFTVQVGKNIEGWIIKKINTNSVIIENNGKTKTIEWSKSKPKIFKTLKKSIKKKVPTKKKTANKNNPFKNKIKSSIPTIPSRK